MLKSDYIRMARAAVSDYEERGVALNCSVKQAAEEMQLNTEQTRRLVEFTNTVAHLHLFDKKAEDKYIEFALADPDVVLAPESVEVSVMKVAHVSDPADYYLPLTQPVAPVMEKAASVSVRDTEPMPLHRRQKLAMRMTRVSEELEMEVRIAHHDYLEKLADFSKTLLLTSPEDKVAFISSARGLYGQDADHILVQLDVSDSRLEVSHEKVAAAEFPIESKLTSGLGELVDARSRVLEAGRGYKYVTDRIGV